MINQVDIFILISSKIFRWFYLVTIVNNEVEMVNNQWDTVEGRLRPRTSGKSNGEDSTRTKVKCNICNKFYRADNLKVRLTNSSGSSLGIKISFSDINNVRILIKKFYHVRVK
jgi:hypothetical protein